MLILALETSCDETAAAVVEDGSRVLSNVVHSQHDLHEKYGGVVPEVASRAHLDWLTPVLREALEQAGVKPQDLSAIAVGNRPGLVGSLLVGVNAAKALSWSLGLPLLGIDHVQAHLYASALETDAPPRFPALGLVASGGHTSLYAVESPLKMTRIGSTIDDAVGEAYDKAAVMLQAGYPGGASLDKLAQQGDAARAPRPLPRSLLSPESLDFSFSGLKTALLYSIRGFPVGKGDASAFARDIGDLSPQERADIAAAFQEAAIGILMTKLRRADARMKALGSAPQALLFGGGVVANSLLRLEAAKLGAKLRLPVHLPKLAYCADNAAMLAGLAHHRLIAGESDDLLLPALPSSLVQ